MSVINLLQNKIYNLLSWLIIKIELRYTVNKTSQFVMQNKPSNYINTRTPTQNFIRVMQLSDIIKSAGLII